MANASPILPPSGVIPGDLLNKIAHPREPGRPSKISKYSNARTPDGHRRYADKIIPTKSGSNDTSPANTSPLTSLPDLTPSRTEDALSVSCGSSGNPTPSGTSRMSASDHSEVPEVYPINTALPIAGVSAEVDEWVQEYVNKRDHRLAARPPTHGLVPPAIARIIESYNIPSGKSRTPGVTTVDDFLNAWRLDFSSEAGYQVRTVELRNLIREFEGLSHDYTLQSNRVSNYAVIYWVDSPGMRPADPRSRRLFIKVDPSLASTSGHEYVWRVMFKCNGCCVPPSNDGDAQDDTAPATSTIGHQVVHWAKTRAAARKLATLSAGQVDALPVSRSSSRRSSGTSSTSTSTEGKESFDACPHSARVMISMTVDECLQGRCSIYIKRPEYHPPPVSSTAKSLNCSPYIRRLLHDASSLIGVTASHLKSWFGKQILHGDDHVKWVDDNFKHRLPTESTFKTAITTSQRDRRLHTTPLVGIEILHAQSRESFWRTNYPRVLTASQNDENAIDGSAKSDEEDLSDPNAASDDRDVPPVIAGSKKRKQNMRKSARNKRKKTAKTTPAARFECVVGTPHSVMQAILLAPTYGIYVDSSWRGKTQFKTPLTFLVTINRYHRMVPIAAMVSNHADTAAYRTLFDAANEEGVRVANKVIAGELTISVDGFTQEQIISACQNVVRSGKLCPAFVMMDGCDAERNATEGAYPGTIIRACQYHVMHACKSKVSALLGKKSADERKVMTDNILMAIRHCQRCPDKALFDQYFERLHQDFLEQVDDEEAWDLLASYLKREWFSDRWQDMVFDFGLPPGVTRDGPWSTNNYTEAAFRTFDRVFLGCRANRRLDRLIAILVTQYFPFYEMTPHRESRAEPQLVAHLTTGLDKWEEDCIRPTPLQAIPMPHRSRFEGQAYCVLPLRRQRQTSASTPRASSNSGTYCGRRDNGRLHCTCQYYEINGKRCSHLWAMHVYELCGSVKSFEANGAVIQAFLDRETGYMVPRGSDGYEIKPNDAIQLAEEWKRDIMELPGLDTLDLGGSDDFTPLPPAPTPGFYDPANPFASSSPRVGQLAITAAPTPLIGSTPESPGAEPVLETRIATPGNQSSEVDEADETWDADDYSDIISALNDCPKDSSGRVADEADGDGNQQRGSAGDQEPVEDQSGAPEGGGDGDNGGADRDNGRGEDGKGGHPGGNPGGGPGRGQDNDGHGIDEDLDGDDDSGDEDEDEDEEWVDEDYEVPAVLERDVGAGAVSELRLADFVPEIPVSPSAFDILPNSSQVIHQFTFSPPGYSPSSSRPVAPSNPVSSAATVGSAPLGQVQEALAATVRGRREIVAHRRQQDREGTGNGQPPVRSKVRQREHIDMDKHIFSALLGPSAKDAFANAPDPSKDRRIAAREISPIGRRFHSNSDIRPDGGDVRTPTPSTDVNMGSGPSGSAFVGRPPNLLPIEPRRRSKKTMKRRARSTISLPAKFMRGLPTPIGMINTKIDCYALSLFQVVLRNHLWQDPLRDASTHLGTRDSLYTLMNTVQGNLENGTLQDYSYLRMVLAKHRIIDDAARMQDPGEVLDKICAVMDSRLRNTGISFTSVFNNDIITRRYCPECKSSDPARQSRCLRSSLALHPLDPGIPDDDLTVQRMLAKSLLDVSPGIERCSRSTCPAPHGAILQKIPAFTFRPALMRLDVVWGLDTKRTQVRGEHVLRTDRTFRIPSKLRYDVCDDAGTWDWEWGLEGVICREGSLTDAGHYTAIIPHHDMWFHIDDDSVFRVHSPSYAAFSGGRYPTMIVYQTKGCWRNEKLGQNIPVNYEPDHPGTWQARRTPVSPVSSDDEAEPDPPSAADANNSGYVDDDSESIDSEWGELGAKHGFARDPEPSEPWFDYLQEGNQIMSPVNHDMPAQGSSTASAVREADQSGNGASGRAVISADQKGLAEPWCDARTSSSVLSSGAAASQRHVPPGMGDRAWRDWASGSTRRSSNTEELSKASPSSGAVHGARFDSPSRQAAVAESSARMATSVVGRLSLSASPARQSSAPTAPTLPSPQSRLQSASGGDWRSARIAAALKRYNSIPWMSSTASLDRNRPITMIPPASTFRSGKSVPTLSPAFFDYCDRVFEATRNAPDAARVGIVFGTFPSQAPRAAVSLDVFRKLRDRRSWWSTDFMDAVSMTAAHLAQAERGHTMNPTINTPDRFPPVVIIPHMFRWSGSRLETLGAGRIQPVIPFPGLGPDSSWRARVSVAIVTVDDQAHFATWVIFGHQRLAIPFDGFAGSGDGSGVRGNWSFLLDSRLEWERREGLCTEEQNEDWLCLDNTPELRHALGWVQQSDAVNCGPLATAAAILVAQGIRPSTRALHMPSARFNRDQADLLRDSIAMLYLLSARDRNPHGWLSDPLVTREISNWLFRMGMRDEAQR